MIFGALSVWADAGRNDAQLRAIGQDKLFHAKLADKVTLNVEDGAATLEGSVDSVWQKERAAKEVSKVDGITRVTNNLTVSAAKGGDDEILDQASREIRKYPYYTIFDNVELSAENGRLVLSGQVTQPWRKDEIGRIVARVSGVTEVENDIEVLPLSAYDDQIRYRVARAIYGEPILSRYMIQANPPIHIVVKNGNVTLVGVVNNEADKVLAGNAAQFAATFFKFDNQLRVETAMAKSKP